jgi:hypothetical protein
MHGTTSSIDITSLKIFTIPRNDSDQAISSSLPGDYRYPDLYSTKTRNMIEILLFCGSLAIVTVINLHYEKILPFSFCSNFIVELRKDPPPPVIPTLITTAASSIATTSVIKTIFHIERQDPGRMNCISYLLKRKRTPPYPRIPGFFILL